ncbi:F-box domain containing protein [Trema orientale]|uniref:F-box domain containing protein n=1 Tax=Trema orientale TaxID=63057 RepID=A0A2P5EVX2_TREOI|nr:F-box domain containing protein [Trema orientale]
MALSQIDEKLEIFPAEIAASKFLSFVGDDVLLDIFYRLPHYRAVIQCSIVCKRWFSVINSNSDEFFQYHNHKGSSSDQYSSTYFPSCTLLLYLTKNNDQPLYLKCLDTSNVGFSTITTSTTTFLDFLPWPDHDVAIRASLDDLFLVSRKCNPRLFCICNPLTKKWIALPEAPRDRLRRGLLRDYRRRYRVVLLDVRPNEFNVVYYATVFRSETGQWSELTYYHGGREPVYPVSHKIFHGHVDQFQGVCTSDGSLHWLRRHKVLIFNLCKARPHWITLPENFGRGMMRVAGESARLGVVRGRLRLLEMYKWGLFGFALKVWELSDDNEDWILVHDRVKWVATMANMMHVLAFHPDNGDEIFLARKFDICLYNIREDTYKKLGEYPKVSDEGMISMFLTGFFTLVHPLCPTSLFELPSIQSQI